MKAWVDPAILMIEGLSSLLIVLSLLRVLVRLGRRKLQPGSARREAAEGILFGLSFKLAATLLKSLEIGGWNSIGAFAAILALRTLIKLALQAEQKAES